ncbi:hypothetical protein KEM55_003581, partial [Ascosphaera atra]
MSEDNKNSRNNLPRLQTTAPTPIQELPEPTYPVPSNDGSSNGAPSPNEQGGSPGPEHSPAPGSPAPETNPEDGSAGEDEVPKNDK